MGSKELTLHQNLKSKDYMEDNYGKVKVRLKPQCAVDFDNLNKNSQEVSHFSHVKGNRRFRINWKKNISPELLKSYQLISINQYGHLSRLAGADWLVTLKQFWWGILFSIDSEPPITT